MIDLQIMAKGHEHDEDAITYSYLLELSAKLDAPDKARVDSVRLGKVIRHE